MMRASPWSLVVVTLLTAILRVTPAAAQTVTWTPNARAVPPGHLVSAEAKALHRRGVVAFNEGKFEAAADAFQAALALDPIPKIAGDLGAAELEIGRYRDAAEHLAWCLRETRDMPADEQAEVLSDLALAKKEVVTLRVGATQTGTEIWADGARVGVAPIDRDLYLEAGKHRIEGRLGEQRVTTMLDVAKGSFQSVSLALQVSAGTTPTPQVPARTASSAGTTPTPQAPGRTPAPDRERTTAPHVWSGWWVIGGGVTLAGLGVGLGTGIPALSRQGEQDRCATDMCVRALEPERHALAQASLAGFVTAGAGALFTGGLLLVERRASDEPRRGVKVSATGTGVTVSGTW